MIKKICKVCGKEFEAVENNELCCSKACQEKYFNENIGLIGGDVVLDKYGNAIVLMGSSIDIDYYDEDGWHYADEDEAYDAEEEMEKARNANDKMVNDFLNELNL